MEQTVVRDKIRLLIVLGLINNSESVTTYEWSKQSLDVSFPFILTKPFSPLRAGSGGHFITVCKLSPDSLLRYNFIVNVRMIVCGRVT